MAIRFAATVNKRYIAACLAVICIACAPDSAGEPQSAEAVAIDWGDKKFVDLSGIGIVGKYLVVANDEAHHAVHVLVARPGGYKYLDHIRLSDGAEELDLEGIAVDGNIIYVIGSHSRNKDNERQKSREKLFRFELGADGKVKGKIDVISLHGTFDLYRELETASHKKPKEGGIDIEGIAVREGWLYAGFRGPLVRSDALVLKFQFDKPVKTSQLLTVDLGGLGIRDLTGVADGFLVLAGPMHDGAGPYQLHHWNGQGGKASSTRRLCTIPAKQGARAEGIAVVREDKSGYELILLYDGPQGGDPTRIRVTK